MFRSPTRRARLVVSVFAAVLAVLGSLVLPAAAVEGPQVFEKGTAQHFGDARNLQLNATIVDFAPTASGNGYWQAAADGGVLTFGDAQFFGSMGNLTLAHPIVAMAGAPDGNGYWLLTRDGGVFSFGAGAQFFGPGTATGKTFVDLVPAPNGQGYWLLAEDGTVMSLGSGAAGVASQQVALPAGVRAVAGASNPAGDGLWVARTDGVVNALGSAPDFGDAPAGEALVDLTSAPDGSGLWVVTASGAVHALGGVTLSDDAVGGRPVVAIAAHSASGYWVATTGAGPGSISGRVVDHLGAPVAGVCVDLGSSFTPSALTGADGAFRIDNLPGGSARVRFGGCGVNQPVVTEYWEDASNLASATPVTVERGNDTDLGDAVVERTATIAGVVRGHTGQPLSTACALAFNNDGSFGNQARATVTGYYRIAGLRSGSYTVSFNDCIDGEHLTEYYDDAPSPDLATPVTVAPGQVREGIDAQLAKAGAITGTVGTADGGPLGSNGACVLAYDERGGVVQQASIMTGAYRLKGLATGAYKVRFNSCMFGAPSFGGPNDYVDEWWDDQPTEATAAPVAVTAGSDTSGINAVVDRAATISGVVTGTGGAPAAFMCVDAVQGTTSVRRTTTAMSGAYQLRGLREGAYAVRFGGCTGGGNLATEWWQNSPTLAGSTAVSVTTGQQRTGIDAALDPAGFFEGQVTDVDGTGVRACVDVYDEAVLLSRTLANVNGVTGAYRVGGLNNNSYKVRFTDCGNDPRTLATEWFQDSPTRDGATPVGAVAGQTTTVPTAVLDRESVISGVVTNTDGQPIAGVCVRPFFADGVDATSENTVATTVTGFYRVQRLPAATYKVKFDAGCGSWTHVSEWWNDRGSMAEANAVTTTLGATTPNIDAVLARRTASGPPAAPSSATAVAGRSSATVNWTGVAGTNLPITGYRVTTSPGGAFQDVGPDARSLVISGLQPGQTYTFTVQARNAFGLGAGTSSNAVFVTGAPGAPGRPAVTPGNGSVALSWGAAPDNGEGITEYVVTASTDGAELRVPGSSTTATFTRPNGVSVTFTVRAVNAAGAGPASAASDAVTPVAPASPPPPSDPAPSGDPEPVQAGSSEIEALPAGSQVLFSGDGFKAFEAGDVTINSTPRRLAGFVTGASGSFSVLVTIPADMELGSHTLVATSKAPDGSVRKLSSPVVVVPAAASTGYRLLAADGGIFTFGDAGFFGSAGGTALRQPIVAGAATPTGDGYWLVGADGAVFTFGDANFQGSLGGIKLNKPIVGMASTPSGQGYWLVASDGGMFAFGDAAFFGSTGDLVLNRPIVGMTASPTGQGYWLVASDGGIFSFGDAAFFGSTGDLVLNRPIVGMTASPTGQGYWLVASDGGIFSFGDAAFFGSTGDLVLNKPIVGMAASPKGDGYRLVASDGGIFAFGDAAFLGSTGDLQLAKPILALL